MSDDNNDLNQYQPQGDYQPQPEHHQAPEASETHGYDQPFAEQPSAETAADAQTEAVVEEAKPDPILARLDAIDTSLAELRASIDELKAERAAAEVVVVEPVVAAVSVAEAPVADETPADVAAAEPVVVAEPAPVIDHTPRFDTLEAAVAELSTRLGEVHAGVVALAGDVADHRNLHASTQAMIDEQHNLMRGLNYIITAAIGTLTAAAKPTK
ncbi:MAG: hypothetical protein P4L98_14815 [Ancalomicrobiaceae bacterium]|nr:hypothetical protein [Ancalomicrobiaceae bacterium]